MGEAADLYVDGVLCVQCGVPVPGEPPGHPRYCSKKCKIASSKDTLPADNPSNKVICPECGKKVKDRGLVQHRKDVHRVQSIAPNT